MPGATPRTAESQAEQSACCKWDCSRPSPAIPCRRRPALSPSPSVAVDSLVIAPLPVANLRQVLSMFVNVKLVLNKLVLNHLFQVRPLRADPRDAIDHIRHQMKAIQIVLHSHVECRRDGAFFLVASNVQIV